jgi:hypothetical protein
MKTCLHPNSNHSNDVMDIHHGELQPLTLCGYHYTKQDLNKTLNEIREARGIMQCPNHQGNFDCTPFCVLCGGVQEVRRINA